MRTNGLRSRAIGALSVVAASLFLLLCLANYGQGGFETAGEAPWHLGVAGWFVEVFGAGAFALVLLPLVWGLVVYFREDTPSLSMRAAGTLLLACSISMVSGLVQEPTQLTWAGSVGEYTVALTSGLAGVMGSGLALSLAWAATLTLFMASLVWATDWWFHSLRKGPVVPTFAARPRLDVEPIRSELRDEDDDQASPEREYLTIETAGAQAASALDAEPAAVVEPLTVRELPEGFSARATGDRMLVRGPAGYAGVEFLPASDELAPPPRPEERFRNDIDRIEERVVDDEIDVVTLTDDTVTTTVPDGIEQESTPDSEPVIAAATATVEETLAADVHGALDPAATVAAAERVVEALVTAADDDQVEVEERPRSGIGLPEGGAFVDEFFSVDVLVADAVGAGDGASADGEIEAAFGTTIPSSPDAAESPVAEQPVAEAPPASPAPPAPAPAPARRPEPVIVDELLFADAYDFVDDEIPVGIAARSVTPPSSDTSEGDDDTAPDLDRIHRMQLDPLFHDAVDVVLAAGRGSAMTLQRRFGIGHGRGLRLLEQMEEAGILAPEDDAGTRDVLIERATWEAFSGSRSA